MYEGAVLFAHDRLAAGLVLVKIEVAAQRETGLAPLVRAVDTPAREDVGDRHHIVLAVARRRADGEQLQQFTAQVFVDLVGGPALAPGLGVRAGRAFVVEVQHHGRVGDRLKQHVAKAAAHAGPQHAHIRPHGGVDVVVGGRHREVVAPEMPKTLKGRRRPVDGHGGPGLHFLPWLKLPIGELDRLIAETLVGLTRPVFGRGKTLQLGLLVGQQAACHLFLGMQQP